MYLMRIYGEFEAFARISECFGLLINGSFIVMEFILRIFCLFWCVTEISSRWSVFTGDPSEDSGSVLLDFCL